ncbi:MAG: ROK family protein [Gemmatimonadota bacterium]|nr:ROK family protein [Gemmatimonadota bacterium]
MRTIIGVDLGGTNIVSGCVAEDGSAVYGVRSVPTGAEEGADAVVQRIIASARATITAAQVEVPGLEVIGLGIGAPGPLKIDTGIVLLTPNLGWVNMPLRQRLADGLGLRAALDNDANCAVLGEWWRGAAQGTRNAVGLTIGTGIGGGIIIGGRLYHGASDIAGEIGHMTIDVHGRRCKCGNYGCVEAYASGPNIALRAVEAIESGSASSLPGYVGGDLRQVTAQLVYEAAKAGDELALDVVRDTARFLGAAVANLINIFNPEAIVVVGGVTLAGEHLFEPLRREVTRRAFKPAVEVCRIVPGTLTGVAGVYGAVRAFQEQVEAGIV